MDTALFPLTPSGKKPEVDKFYWVKWRVGAAQDPEIARCQGLEFAFCGTDETGWVEDYSILSEALERPES